MGNRASIESSVAKGGGGVSRSRQRRKKAGNGAERKKGVSRETSMVDDGDEGRLSHDRDREDKLEADDDSSRASEEVGSPDSVVYADAYRDATTGKLSLSRSSSSGSMMSTYSKGGGLSSGCPTPISEYLAFEQPFKSVSFSCGGWLQFYLFGVARAFQAKGIHKGVKWAGCSAGALAAAGIALDGDFDAAIDFCKKKCLPRTEYVSGLFTLDEYVGSCIDTLLIKAGKFRELESGELQVAITKFPYMSSVRVTEHHSAQDLKETLLSSAAAYPAAPIHNHSRFGLCIDGGLSDFQPTIDSDTVTVSPFYFSDCDIRPSRYVPPWWAFVPPKDSDTVDWTYNLGYEDAMDYIRKRNVGSSPHAVRHLRKGVERNTDHEFDTPRRISVHRFLGYNPRNLTAGNAISFLCDLILLVLFTIILKPLALLAIYAELCLNAISTFAEVIVGSTLVMFSPLMTALLGIFHFRINGHLVFRKPDAVRSLEVTAHRLLGLNVRRQRGRDLVDTLSCILSLSLLLRFFSSFNRPSNTELRKHDRLYRHSLLYRVLRHAV